MYIQCAARVNVTQVFQKTWSPNWNSNAPCRHCPRNASTLPKKDLSLSALWISQRWWSQVAAHTHAHTHAHIIFTLIAVTIMSVVSDALHVTHLEGGHEHCKFCPTASLL